MKIGPAWWFGGACGLCTVVLAAIWLPGDEAPPVVATPLVAHVASSGAAEGDAAVEDRDVDGWAESIIARPLFSIGRRPPKTGGGGHTVSASGLPRLSGIMITPAGRRAIFMPDGGKPLVLAEGASLEDGTIRSITTNGVVVASPKGDMLLHPSFDRNRVPSAPVVPSAMFQQPNFAPNLPNQGFNPGFPQPGIPQPPNIANGDGQDDQGAPAPPPPQFVQQPPMPGFRNPALPRVRE